MFVITRNGRVITGWRAWLIGLVTIVGVTLLFSVIAFAMLGVAVTMGAILMIVVPVVFFIALLASIFGKRI